MVDYVVGTGTSGSLIIRDTGSTVYAIIKCTNPSTFANGVPWQVTLGGGAASGTFNISGNQEVVVWSGNVTSTANMSLWMGSTGTSGLGGPAQVNATISRATIPDPPYNVNATNIGPTNANITFYGPGNNGGAAIDYYLVRLSKNNPPWAAPYSDQVNYNGNAPFTGLEPGTTYYACVYAHNGVGYSNPSGVISFRTLGPMRVRIGGIWKYAIPYIKVSGIWKMATPFVKRAGVWKKTG